MIKKILILVLIIIILSILIIKNISCDCSIIKEENFNSLINILKDEVEKTLNLIIKQNDFKLQYDEIFYNEIILKENFLQNFIESLDWEHVLNKNFNKYNFKVEIINEFLSYVDYKQNFYKNSLFKNYLTNIPLGIQKELQELCRILPEKKTMNNVPEVFYKLLINYLNLLFVDNNQSIFYTIVTKQNTLISPSKIEYNLILQTAFVFCQNNEYFITTFLNSQDLFKIYHNNNQDTNEFIKILLENFTQYVEQHIITNTTNLSVEHLQEMQKKAFNVLKIYVENLGTLFYSDYTLHKFVINNINWNSYIYTYDCQSGNMKFIINCYTYNNYKILPSTFNVQLVPSNLYKYLQILDLLKFNTIVGCSFAIHYKIFCDAFINNLPLADIQTPEVLNLYNDLFIINNNIFIVINFVFFMPIIILTNILKIKEIQEFSKEINITYDMLNSPFELCFKNLSLFFIITLIIAIYIFYHYLILFNLKNK